MVNLMQNSHNDDLRLCVGEQAVCKVFIQLN